MDNTSTLFNEILRKASTNLDKNLINKLNDKEYKKDFLEALSVINDLGYDLIDSSSTNDTNNKISRALISGFIAIYYVNIVTGSYLGYTPSCTYKALKIEESGTDFFSDTLKNIERVIYSADREYMRKNFTKENINRELSNNKTFSLVYRLLIDNEPVYVTLKVFKLSDADENIVIGVSNIDKLKRQELEYKNKMEENITYTNIALALAKNFFDIFYVDTETDEYKEYRIDSELQRLILVSEGPHFFDESIINAKTQLVAEDVDKFLKAIEKKNLLAELKENKTFRLTYRQIFDSVPVYVRLTALNLIQDSSHIIIAISNIDKEIEREREYEKNLEAEKIIARTDALTKAKNKYSYGETEKIINAHIKSNASLEFSVVVCDINYLKQVNDLYGHDAGDKYIIEAKNILSKIFKNTSVYRIGGDEFLLILEGTDYYKRDHLMEILNEKNEKNRITNKVTIACGISDYIKDQDQNINQVFLRADKNMYENKNKFKNQK